MKTRNLVFFLIALAIVTSFFSFTAIAWSPLKFYYCSGTACSNSIDKCAAYYGTDYPKLIVENPKCIENFCHKAGTQVSSCQNPNFLNVCEGAAQLCKAQGASPLEAK